MAVFFEHPVYFKNFGKSHWNAAKLIAKDLNWTKHCAITFGKGNEIVGNSYAYWAGELESRKSISGIIFTTGGTAFV